MMTTTTAATLNNDLLAAAGAAATLAFECYRTDNWDGANAAADAAFNSYMDNARQGMPLREAANVALQAGDTAFYDFLSVL